MFDVIVDFFDTDEFAQSATINGVAVPGIYSRAYVEVNGVGSTTPVFACATSLITNIAYGATVVVGGDNMQVVDIQPDGTGLTRLMLSKN